MFPRRIIQGIYFTGIMLSIVSINKIYGIGKNNLEQIYKIVNKDK